MAQTYELSKAGLSPEVVIQKNLVNQVVSADTTIEMVEVPKGFHVTHIDILSTTIGAGEYTITVGDGGNTSRFISTETSGALNLRFGYGGTFPQTITTSFFRYTEQDTIDFTVSAATNFTVSALTFIVRGFQDNTSTL